MPLEVKKSLLNAEYAFGASPYKCIEFENTDFEDVLDTFLLAAGKPSFTFFWYFISEFDFSPPNTLNHQLTHFEQIEQFGANRAILTKLSNIDQVEQF